MSLVVLLRVVWCGGGVGVERVGLGRDKRREEGYRGCFFGGVFCC